MDHIPKSAPPSKATIITIKREDGSIVVNCAGFKHKFPNEVAAAKFLDMDWQEFNRMILLNATNAAMILIRKDHLDPWRLSSEPR